MKKGIINNLQENCPYFDKDKRCCARNGCHLLRPCIAKGTKIEKYYSIKNLLDSLFVIIKE